MDNCCTEENMDFANAHWEEIEEKLCEIAKQREEKIENDKQYEDDSEEVL